MSSSSQPEPQRWQDITPRDAVHIDLSVRLDITAPRNELGERCPWPWEPQQMTDVPLGQYHCGACGAMVVAGQPHLDYSDDLIDPDDFGDDPTDNAGPNTIDIHLPRNDQD